MKFLSSKPIFKQLLQLSAPIILANLLQIVYQFTDLFWVGRHGTEEVAAISIASPVIFFFVSLGIGFTIAGTILVSQYKGNKNQEALNHVVGQSIFLTTISSLIMSAIWYIFAPQVIIWMWADTAVAIQAVAYLKVSFIGMIFVFGYMSVQWLLRGLWEVKRPMFIVLGTVLLNFIIDPLFIMGYGWFPEYWVKWAALATICTQSLAYFAILLLMYKNKNYEINFRRKYFVLKRTLIKKLLALWIPSSIEMSARSLGMVVLTYIVAGFWTTVTAAYWIGGQVLSIMIFVAVGFSMATTTLVGHAFGSGDNEKVDIIWIKWIKLSATILSILGVIIFVFAKPILSVFSPTDSEVVIIWTKFLRIIALFFGSIGIQQVISGVFRGMGDTKIPMMFTIVSLRIVQIPFAYFVSLYRGELAIWISFPIANILVAFLSWFWYKKGNRKEKKIVSKSDSFA